MMLQILSESKLSSPKQSVCKYQTLICGKNVEIDHFSSGLPELYIGPIDKKNLAQHLQNNIWKNISSTQDLW